MVAAEHSVNVLVRMTGGQIVDFDTLEPALLDEQLKEGEVVATLVFPKTVVKLKVESGAQGAPPSLENEMLKESGESEVWIGWEPVEVKVERRVEAVVDETTDLKVRPFEVCQPLFGIAVVVGHQDLLSIVHNDASEQEWKLDGLTLPIVVLVPLLGDVGNVLEVELAHCVHGNGILFARASLIERGADAAFAEASFFGVFDMREIVFPHLSEEQNAREVIFGELWLGGLKVGEHTSMKINFA